ncbi:MAG: class D sortase [Gaiellaceae bacterium]
MDAADGTGYGRTARTAAGLRVGLRAGGGTGCLAPRCSDAAWKVRAQASRKQRAVAFGKELRPGDALGRLEIPRLGLRVVVVEGTSADELARGPGHYPTTPLPGLGGTAAVAGHRTTYSHPFRHLDELGAGDRIDLTTPYGSFRYIVHGRRVVDDRDWSIVRPRSFEQLVLTACHPLYSAAKCIIVSARLGAAV